ncbi:MAG: hypothetical protein U0325_36280, partial [Polyangiales bacterium]
MVGAIVGCVMLLCVAGIVAGFFLDRDEQRAFGAAAAACEGRAVVGARGYVAGPSGHRVVGATQRGDRWRANNLKVPERLRATAISDADVVACIGEETQTVVGTCQVYRTRVGIRVPGSDRTFERRQRSLAVRLVSATTGQTITQGAVPGAAPRTCDQTIGRSAMDSDFVGAAPDDDAIGR